MKKRILSLALAMVMVVSMAIPAFALSSGNPTNANPLQHTPHYSNGKLLEQVNPPKSSQFPDIVYGNWKANKEDTKVMYTVNLKVGEKITVHIPHPYMRAKDHGQGYYKVWVTSLDFFDASMYNGDKELTDLKYSDMKFHNDATNIDGGKMACTELYITGTKEGTAEMIYTIEPFAPQLIRIVVGSGTPQAQKPTTQTSTQKPTDNTPSQKPTTPAAPADKNTVKVAGQDRTLGQIQNISDGYMYTVNHGDTLYDLAKRFYGNGNLWKELQAVNQKNLNETKNGIIFVGFNLIIPAELNGVRANVG